MGRGPASSGEPLDLEVEIPGLASARRIGLLGGTFDPVHYGHLVIGEVARTEFGLDRVVWIPSGSPPHKQGDPVMPQEHRYAMTVLATATHPQFAVSRLELERRGPSYTIDTVATFLERFPRSEIFVVTGADAMRDILTWHRHADLIRVCRHVAVSRPGYSLKRLEEVLPAAYLPHIHSIAAPGVDISSTQIRERIAAGKPIRYLVPEAVESYIQKYHLYEREPGRVGVRE